MMKKAAGFTLLEATLAITVLSVGMLGLTGAFSQIINSNVVSNHKQTAVFLATTKLAQLRSMPLTKVGELKGSFNEPFNDYTWQGQFAYRQDNNKVAGVWLEVRHKSGVGVKLWTQVLIDNVVQ